MRIPINLNDYHEPTTAPAGQKYNLVIAAAEETRTKTSGKPQFRVSIGFKDHPDYQNLTHFVGIPADGDEPDAMRFKALLLKRFLGLFKVPVTGSEIDTEAIALALPGAETNAEVSLSEPTDDGTVYNRLVVPRLKEEAGAAVGGRKAPPPPKS
jgi:hypothetical protein